jgi:hypothetical protein
MTATGTSRVLSARVRHERNDYDDVVERTQKGALDVAPWLEWFLGGLVPAFDGAESTLAAVLRTRVCSRRTKAADEARVFLVLE